MKKSLRLMAAVLAVLTICCVLTAKGQFGQPAPPPDKDAAYDIAPLYREVRQLARRHYPQATAHHLNDAIHFEYNTRLFIVHEPQMTGEWQDPWPERGPQRGGIHCDISIVPGGYQGQAVIPQNFDKRYYTLALTAPYSQKLDAHLLVYIKYPRNVPAGFLDEMNKLLNDFDKFASKVAPPAAPLAN